MMSRPRLDHRLLRLDEHIHTFATRSLSDDRGSLRPFTGVSNRYGSGNGLGMLVGLPFGAMDFQNGGHQSCTLSP